VCGPGRPTVLLVESKAPLPDSADESQSVSTERFSSSQRVDEPLSQFSMRFEGAAESYDDPAAILRAEEPDDPSVALRLDLTWATDGEPYRWPVGSRYEIPCRIAGTIYNPGETSESAGRAPRHISGGARDWWGADWMWSAFHLEDGTHTHLVTNPAYPGRGIGYVQGRNGLIALRKASSTFALGADGLVTRDKISMPEAELELDVEPLAYGPLRLASDDGRASRFVRAMSRVTASDGRQGLGWIEWNLNQPR
jgi:hypothetical protein